MRYRRIIYHHALLACYIYKATSAFPSLSLSLSHTHTQAHTTHLCTCFNVLNATFLCQGLSLAFCHGPFEVKISLIPDDHGLHSPTPDLATHPGSCTLPSSLGMRVNICEPVVDVLERVLVCHIKTSDNGMCPSVIGPRNDVEFFLTGSVFR